MARPSKPSQPRARPYRDYAFLEQLFDVLPGAARAGAARQVVRRTRFSLVEQTIGGLGPDVRRLSRSVRREIVEAWLGRSGELELAGTSPDAYLEFISADPQAS